MAASGTTRPRPRQEANPRPGSDNRAKHLDAGEPPPSARRRPPGRRAGRCGCDSRRSKARGLLSLAAPARSVVLDLADRYRGPAADVASFATVRPVDHGATAGTAAGAVDDRAHTTRPGASDSLDPPPPARITPGADDAIKHSSPLDVASREDEDSLVAFAHSTDPNSSASTSGLSSIEPETMSTLAADAADATGGASVVAWAPGAAAPLLNSLVNAAGRVLGLDGRSGAGTSTTVAFAQLPGSMALLVSGLDVIGPVSGDAGTIPDLQGDPPFLSPVEMAGPNGETLSPVWADVLDGSLRSDWEAVDAELRQFLVRFGVLAEGPSGREPGPVWRLWIAAAVVLLVAGRRYSCSRRLFRSRARRGLGRPIRAHRSLAPGSAMTHEPLDSLLEKLCSGDPAAAESVFRTFEPYLRMVVRKKLPARLRAKFDSMDIVQSVWADLLCGFREAGWRFPDEAHLRAFLVKLTRHRFIDRVRRHRTSIARERPLGELSQADEPRSRLPSPSELVLADELGQRMLALCPPAHREIIRLRLRGIPVAEIAIRTGLHVGSVHRLLHDLACRVAVERGSSPPRRPAPATEGCVRDITRDHDPRPRRPGPPAGDGARDSGGRSGPPPDGRT